jgi:putative ABC transport system permease protein
MKQPQSRLPKFGDWLLKLLARYDVNPHLRGDFDEEFSLIYETKGFVKAWFWYWTHLLRSLPFFIRDILYWRFIMFKNYLKIALRNLKRHKGYSIINMAGLTIGLTAFILIFLYVRYELSYDRFHKNAGDIYRVFMHQKGNVWKGSDMYNSGPPGLAAALKEDYPEIINAVRMYQRSSGEVITIEEKNFKVYHVLYAEPEFLEMFSFPLKKGNPKSALKDPTTMLITEKASENYFGSKDPLGQSIAITFPNREIRSFQINGVLENVPDNSHVKFDFLVPFQNLLSNSRTDTSDWRFNFVKTYIQFIPNTDIEEFEKKLISFNEKHSGTFPRTFHIQPLTDIHLHGHLNNEFEVNSDIKYIYIFSAVAVFVLLIACFNYMNLSTAHSVKRAREVGLRKVMGADKRSIIKQFLGESFLSTAFAFIVSIFLVNIMLPSFNVFLNRKIVFNVFGDPTLLCSLFLFLLVTALISGSFPAFHLSSFQPVRTLKGVFKSGSKGRAFFRNTLVVTQFVITTVMIISTVVIFRQMHFIQNQNLGFVQEHIIDIPLVRNLKDNFEAFKNELSQYSKISDITLSVSPANVRNLSFAEWEGKEDDEARNIYKAAVDHSFIDFYGIEIIEGRKFLKDMVTDDTAFILNETAVNNFNLEDPIGKKFSVMPFEGTIVGVMKDFYFLSLHLPMAPLALSIEPAFNLSIKVNTKDSDLQQIFALVEDKYKQFFPGYPFEYSFLDENIKRMYDAEKKQGKIFNYFTFVAIFIACLGLYGLALNMTEQRTKEIGIRKVLGSRVSGVVLMLSKESLILVFIANLIAWPLAFYAMNTWLQNFAYRINIGIGIFALSSALALIIAMLSIAHQSVKAATANPIDSLRYE